MSNLFDGPPLKLRAITINGSIVVESDDDVKKREERRKQRKSRWDKSNNVLQNAMSEVKKDLKEAMAMFPNMKNTSVRDNPQLQAALREQQSYLQPTLDSKNMDEKSQKIYLLHLQIQEATRNLAKPDLGIPPDPRDRSPSPEPVYNNEGVRINTRLERTRALLLMERNSAIAQLKEVDPTYQPPAAFKFKNAKLEDRVILPAEEYPHINFIGLILGPRGNHLEELKRETNCNIIIRGKGSLRSGMTGITKNGKVYEGLEDPLHVYITGATAEEVAKASKKIQDLVHLHIYNPESEQAVALRAKHMHELAMLNGTLKEIDMKCLNCGRFGHKSWECDERPNFTSAVICTACGGVGHLTSDCKQRRPGAIFVKATSTSKPEVIDKEYEAFMTDLTGKKPEVEKRIPEEFVPPMGDVGKCFRPGSSAPLMLTNGSSAPGAASAFVRSMNNPQTVNSAMQIVGKSIFGGNMTKMTSGYKTKFEIELEKEKKKQEFEQRPVPIEWQVERYEKTVNKQQEEYLEQLEQYCADQKKKKQDSTNVAKSIVFAPPPPPPPPVGSWAASSPDDGLPNLIGNPLSSFKK